MAKCPKCESRKSTVGIICVVTFFHYEHESGNTEGPWFEEDSDPADRVQPIYIPKKQVHRCIECNHTWIVDTPDKEVIGPQF